MGNYGPAKVLIVDDVPKNIQLLGNFLANEKLQIAFATNAEDALNLAFSNQFDLFLLDIMMPGMDGFQLCDKLKSNKKTADVPVIFLTAKTDPESIVLGFELGAQDYVTKPFNAFELIARVRTQLELRAKRLDLIALNQSLEQKVKQRTASLEIANRQISRLEKAKSEFLAIISHELRSPLSGINSLAGLLGETMLDAEQKKYIENLKDVADRLIRFSEMAILITSLRADEQKPDLYQVSLNILIEMALDEMTKQVNEKNIKVVFHNPKRHIQVLADADLIRKCLSILTEVAIQIIAVGGQIQYHLEEKHGTASICMELENIQLDTEAVILLKEQLETDTLVTNETLGLTLAAIKLIMDAHNGKLDVFLNEEGRASICLLFNENQQF